MISISKHSINALLGTLYIILSFSCSESSNSSVKSLLKDYEIRGDVLEVDSNNSTVMVKILAEGNELALASSSANEVVRFQVQPGDLSLLESKSTFRSMVQESFSPVYGKIHLLHRVWPDDRVERIRFNNVNRLLRRDTLSMGDDMIRGVGDFVPPFALYDQDGSIITSEYFDGSITVLNFIFSRCSIAEMCPASTLKMKKLQDLVSKINVPFVKFLSITLDPEYDTPGILKSYARAYDLDEQNFKLGTAGKTVIDDLTRQFGILRKNEEELPLDHTMRTLMINQKRQIIWQVPGKNWSVEDFLSRMDSSEAGTTKSL